MEMEICHLMNVFESKTGNMKFIIQIWDQNKTSSWI